MAHTNRFVKFERGRHTLDVSDGSLPRPLVAARQSVATEIEGDDMAAGRQHRRQN